MKTSEEIHNWITGGEGKGKEERRGGILMTGTGKKWLREDSVIPRRHYSPIDPRVSKLFQFYRFLSTYSCQAFK